MGVAKNDQHRSRQRAIVSWVAVFLWMGLIFYLSHQPAETSAQLSRGVSDVVYRAISYVFDLDIEVGPGGGVSHHWVRKAAHGFLYFMLGVWVVHAFKSSGTTGRKAYLAAFVFCVCYALTDEVHQVFIPGRSGELGDVMIDSLGSFLGLSVYSLGAGMRKVFG